MTLAEFGVGNIITIVVLGLTGLVAYFGWQRSVDLKFSVLDRSVTEKFAASERSFDTRFSALAIQINTIMMRDVESMTARLMCLEADSADVHKRFHALSGDINGLGLKLDRLERPRA